MKRIFKTALTMFATVAFASVSFAGGRMGTKCQHAGGMGIKAMTAVEPKIVQSNSQGSTGTVEGVH